jgi:hypothetical protein
MGFDEENIGGELAVTLVRQLVEDLGGFSMMLTTLIPQSKIDRTIDKDSSVSKRQRGKGHGIMGAIGASNVLVVFPGYTA